MSDVSSDQLRALLYEYDSLEWNENKIIMPETLRFIKDSEMFD